MEFARRRFTVLVRRVAVPGLMLQVLAALVPAAIAHVWFFGPGFIFNLLVACHFRGRRRVADDAHCASGPRRSH